MSICHWKYLFAHQQHLPQALGTIHPATGVSGGRSSSCSCCSESKDRQASRACWLAVVISTLAHPSPWIPALLHGQQTSGLPREQEI